MLNNYIKIAFRNLLKNKTDSFISIGGLAVGLACCILLVFYVRFEWSVDNFHENEDRVYRLTYRSVNSNSGEEFRSLSTPFPLGASLESSYPEIDRVINLSKGQVHIKEGEKFLPQMVMFADPGFFRMFTFPLVSGNREEPLTEPDRIVLTEETAVRLFGTGDAVGETVTVRLHKEEYALTVSAVARDIPANSSMQFGMVLPFENYFRNEEPGRVEMMRSSWWIGFGELWITLKEDASREELESKFPALLKSQFGERAETSQMKYGLQPLEGAYFDQQYQSGITGNSNKMYSMILGGIALVILAIAGMNFMSLTLTRAFRRSHEMGIRKAAGAQSRQINLQIFGEVLLTCGFAFALGMVLAALASPLFQQVTGKYFEVAIFSDPLLWMILGCMLLLLTVITGFYPAVSMSRRKASNLFSSRGATERIPLFVKGLVSTQFALAIAFLIITLTMSYQLNYLLDKDLGYSASNVLTVELNLEGEEGRRLADTYSQEARQIPGVQQVSVLGGYYRADPRYIQGGMGFGMGTMQSATSLPGFDGITSEIADENYLDVLDITLMDGRNFSRERPAEIAKGILVNEAFVEKMGWSDPVGQVIEDKAEGWTPPFDGKEVIGVIGDYHFRPLHEQLQPIAIQHIDAVNYGPPGTILVRTAPGFLDESIDRLSALWNEVIPQETFSYNFLDEMVALQYQEELRWKSIIQFSSFMAIALACFGLFGLAILSAHRRTKEIGIRKVLGATVTHIVTLLSRDFVKLVALGFVVAIPIGWYAMNYWLANFAYRIELGPGIFALAGGAALLIALVTVSWQSVRAAVANPVDSLRSE